MNEVREAIEARAYDLYILRDGAKGSQLEDWLKAEKEIAKERAQSANAQSTAKTPPLKVAPKAVGGMQGHFRK